ncbi:hypothetical protein AVEN_177794-1 [Araneus ventricosus]|uniref:Uncharacterized protein n=1 Tax=Araneus ventricosus TaxID=182803 RepID=A0A4Y2RWJ3_ARAVE|nr:hypothetical protein AVEN_31000-1 [Araneus ventricosus]GBN80264.1 hypothetical protein AVEN_269685-1 [Araneus ventricosus]GBO02944.1 hypothetical protein AVEN_177794-1 [Araneus ventricosus]
MGLEVGNDIDELEEDHNQELTTEELMELHCVSQQEVVQESWTEDKERPGEWLMNYSSVIRPSAGQTTQPQSCASLHGVDWKRSTPN